MTPGWGRKRCSRRPCPPPLYVPMPRTCLDSLQIPTLQPYALHQTPRTEYVPRCVQPSCGIKHRVCHCANKNYCTAETCSNGTNCMQSENLLSPDGIKVDKDKNSVCNGPCQQEGRERNSVEGYEIVEPSCNEASCEQLENCGIRSISNDEQLIHPVSYTPSVTNQSSLSRTPPIAPSRMTTKSNNYDDVNKSSKINRSIQINMKNETVSGRRRDAESSVIPEVCCSGNEVPNTSSLSESSQCKLCNEDKISGPVQNITSYFDAAIEKYDTNAQSYSQSSKTPESHLNTHDSIVGDNGCCYKDNVILLTDENNNNPNKPVLNSCCNRSYINGTPTQCGPQSSPGINIDRLHVRDNYEHILPKENVLPNYIPSRSKITPYVNASTSNEMSILGNNSTNERRLFNEGKNQFMSSASNDFRISATPQRHLGASEATSYKQPQFMSPSTNIQPIKSNTKPLLNNYASQVRFHDNNHIDNANYPSPIENLNPKYNALPRSSEMHININSSKEINSKNQPTNSAISYQNDVICEDSKQGCCTHGASETAKERELPNYKSASYLGCVCPDESWIEKKNAHKFASYDLKDIRCEKKPACIFEDGTTSCASTSCVVNQHVGCSCRYPPAFKQFSCTGNISGICNCNDEH